jgi:carbon-monoxide dehydrogenase large subunit
VAGGLSQAERMTMENGNSTKAGVGASVRRKEDGRHLHGRGNFASDMIRPGQREVAFLRSPIAHGRIRGITKPAGREDEIFISGDLHGMKPIIAVSTIPSYRTSEQPALASGKVRYVGEPVAMCIAPSRAEAEDLAEQITLDIDELPVVIDAFQARNDTSVRVHEHWPHNLFMSLEADIAFEEHARNAPVVVKREISLARHAMVPMEGKAVLAYWDDQANQLVVYSSCQVPHLLRVAFSEFLDIGQHQVRVIAPDVGGGFGYKAHLHTEEICVAWLAYKFRAPFRYVEDRREHLVAGAVCREHYYKLTAYADERGRLLALDAEITVDSGAYSVWPFTCGVEPGQATGNLPGPYDFRGYRCKTYCVATNKPPLMPYRGVARTGVCFAIEQTIDAVARAVGREPCEVRAENLVPASAMPYDNVVRKHYDSGDYPKSLEIVKEKIGFEAVRARQKKGEPDGRLIGIGFATYCEQSAHGTSVFAAWGSSIVPGYEQATVRTTPDGGLEIRVGIHSHGQGLETTLAQVAHEILGVEFSRIQVVHGDTGVTPFSTGTYASRCMVMAGGAVAETCESLIPQYVRIGAHLLQCKAEDAKFEKGRVLAPGGGSVDLKEIAESWYYRPQNLPADVGRGGLEATMGFRPKRDTGFFSYGSHAAVIAVDPELGQVELLDYVISEDCGTMVNPMIVDGQVFGGCAQGIGTAMFEEVQYDVNGQPNVSTFADYLIPGAAEVPHFRIFHMETPSPYTKFGIKGVGEGGAIAPPAVILNAVNDALRHLGVDLNSTPITPRRIVEALEAGKSIAANEGKAA